MTCSSPYYGVSGESARFYVSNALEELDIPGEMYYDRASTTLYAMPMSRSIKKGASPAGREPSRRIEVSTFKGPFFFLDDASHVTIACIGFERVRGNAISVKGGAHVNVMHGVFRDIGNTGVHFGAQRVGSSPLHRSFRDTMWDRKAGYMHAVAFSTFERIGASAAVLGGTTLMLLCCLLSKLIARRRSCRPEPRLQPLCIQPSTGI